MARTTADAVKLILAPGRDYDTRNNPSLAPFIDTASVMVDRCAAYAADHDLTVTASELEILERWLAAHYYKVSDRPYKQKSTDSAQGSFDGNTAKRLESTLYGQTALDLDSSGYLASVSSDTRKVARAYWLGKRPSEQIDYVDRD